MSKANGKSRYFVKRGVKTVNIEFDEEEVEITVNIPTNYQHDTMMQKYTELSATGSVTVNGADLMEERLIVHLIELPFDVPYDEEMEQFGKWSNASDNQKRAAIRLLDSDLRDKINNAIVGVENLEEDEVGN